MTLKTRPNPRRPLLKLIALCEAWALAVALLMAGLFWSQAAHAHSSSNSYLSLTAPDEQLTLRADIHLRDVDFMLDLDGNRDGQISWQETLDRAADIETWLRQGIQLSAFGQNCSLGNTDLQASQRADGTYLSAQWGVNCPELKDLTNVQLSLTYALMFAQDSLHRALLKVELPDLMINAVLSPERPQAQIVQSESGSLSIFGRYVVEGIWHIWIGVDHIVFLLSLLVLAPLIPSRQRLTQWRANSRAAPAVKDVLMVVTAFTVAHSITLGLSVMKWLEPSADLIEPAIAISVVLAALNNLLGWSALKRWPLAFVFGLVHGFGFANVLLDLGLPASALAISLAGFNVGVELGQLAIVLAFMPLAWFVRNTLFYRVVVVAGGSLAIVFLGTFWTLQRTGLI